METIPRREQFKYHQFYCEENVYHLTADLLGSHRRLQALFISNLRMRCLFYNQRAAPPGRPLVWDYHVVLLDGPHADGTETGAPRYRIFDFDTRLEFGLDAERYLHETFRPPGLENLRPLFRLVAAREFLATFSTDRRHMREDPENPDSPWQQPPPPWEPPQGPSAAGPHELPRFIAMEPGPPGVVVNLEELLETIRLP